MDFIESLDGATTFSEAHVDRSSNVIQNMTLLGRVSKNGRRYSERAMQDAVRLYDGVAVYFDHPTDRELRDRGGSRSVLDLAGRIRNPRLVGDRVRGDLEVLRVEPGRSLIFALAEQMPSQAGSSHRATGRVRREGGQDVVEGIDKVFAVELVTDPATTSGLFESVQKEREMHQQFEEVTDAHLEEAYDKLFGHHDPGPIIREQHQQFEEVTDAHLAEAYDKLFI